jgi:hypothetical protein
MKLKKSKLKASEQPKNQVVDVDKINKQKKLDAEARKAKIAATISKVTKFIGSSLLLIFLLLVIFSMIAIPLLIVFG